METVERTATYFLKFKREELKDLPRDFKRLFIACGSVARLIKRWLSSGGIDYEVIFKRQGYNIVVAGSDLLALKAEFLQKARETQGAKREYNGLPIITTVIDDLATAALTIAATVAEQKEVV